MAVRGAYQKINSIDRERLINCFQRDDDWLALADILEIRRQTARSIMLRFRETGMTEPSRKGGAMNIKVNDNIKQCALSYVAENSQATLNQIKNHIQIRTGVGLHISTISRLLDGELYTLKLARVIPETWNTESTKTQRQAFADWMVAEGSQKQLVYIDEFGVNIWTRRSQGRSIRGERAVRVVHKERGKNLTVILAVSPVWRLVHYQTLSGGLHGDQFTSFMMECSALLEEEHAVFIYDNARAHNNPPGLLSEYHEQKFLPPYSPILNACEMAGSSFKAKLKSLLSEPDNQQRFGAEAAANARLTLHNHRLHVLHELSEAAVREITVEKCQKWYRHTLKYLPKCARKEDITD